MTRVGVIVLAILCAGCGGADETDASQAEADALACGESETCVPGLCIDEICLDASADCRTRPPPPPHRDAQPRRCLASTG